MTRSLREAGEAAGMPIGAAVAAKALKADAGYRNLLNREFSLLTCENAMKMGPIHPAPGRYDFRDADLIADFARSHGHRMRGHTLVWHNQCPKWVDHGKLPAKQLAKALDAHIRTVVARYRDVVSCWDVVNEAIGDDAKPRPTVWSRTLGAGYLGRAFKTAHEADPKAVLFYNDYNIEEVNPKSTATIRMVEGMLRSGIPVHGIGIQGHLMADRPPDWKKVKANFRRIGELGLVMQITELDFRIKGRPTAQSLRRQADATRRLADLCLESGHCTGFVWWGATDKYSWVPGFFRGYGHALPFDRSFRPKPAARVLTA